MMPRSSIFPSPPGPRDRALRCKSVGEGLGVGGRKAQPRALRISRRLCTPFPGSPARERDGVTPSPTGGRNKNANMGS
jgi:hypothetical protein